jgi:cytochrome bd ubiquinol oxidase subunit II
MTLILASTPSGYWHLQTLWFALIAILWIGYFVLEGFDFGVGTLLPFLGRDDTDRRVIINTIGPVWDGNEVWLLVAGGATFAAFPDWYATLFSGFYLALFAILFALIVRGVAFEYRGKHDSPRWRTGWDWAIFTGSALPALLWGVGFGNIVNGVPIDRSGEFTGNFFTLLNPYSLFAGLTSLALFTLHGAVFLTIRTKGDLVVRAREAARTLSLAAAILVVAFLAWTYVNAVSAHDKGVVPGVIPLSAVGLAIAVPFIVRAGRDGLAFTATALTIGLITATIFLNLYPRVMVSSTSKAFDLTVWNSSSSHYTLAVMTVVALSLTPVVLLYQGWTYYVFRHRVGRDDLGPVKSPIELLSGGGSDGAAGAPSGD